MARFVIGALAIAAVSGCAAFGGVATVKVDGSTLEASAASATIGTQRVATRSGHAVRQLD